MKPWYSIVWQKVGNPSNNGTATGSDFYQLTFPSAGTYQVSITPGSGTFNQINFSFTADRTKLLEIKQWGNIRWTSMAYAYYGCSNLTITATDKPDLQDVKSISYMFNNCSSLTTVPDMELWDVKNITNMSGLFSGANNFNQPIGRWNTANVINMNSMFDHAEKFNQPIANWNTGKVTEMSFMFSGARAFNQPHGSFNRSHLSSLSTGRHRNT